MAAATRYTCRLAATALLGAVLALWTAAAYAQWWGDANSYVNFTGAKVERLSNAVRVTLEADGALRADSEGYSYFGYDARRGRYMPTLNKRVSVNALNARSQIGSYVDVNIYPVSHVVLSVPAGATEGVGLIVSTILYAPGQVGRIQRGDGIAEWGRWMSISDLQVDMILSDNRRELIITVQSGRTYNPDDDRKTTAAESLTVERSDGGLQVRAINCPIDRFCREVSEASGTGILVSPGVVRRVTANLPTMPVQQMLETLCRITCLQLGKVDGAFHISSDAVDDASSYWATSFRKLKLQYISVDSALLLLPDCVLRYLKSDTESNTLLAFGPPPLLDKIEADLKAVDVPTRQIVVEAMVVEMRDGDSARRALDTLVEGGTTSLTTVANDGSVRVGIVDESLHRIRLALQNLGRQSVVRTDVRPRVVVTNGVEARFFVGRRQYYKAQRLRRRGTIEAELRALDVGVELVASPWTGDGDHITVPFEISSDVIAGRTDDANPIVSRQSAEGCLRIRSGETLVFGGMRTSSGEVTRRSIHPLEGAPLVGDLLSSIARATETAQIAFFVTATCDLRDQVRPAPADLAHAERISSRRPQSEGRRP